MIYDFEIPIGFFVPVYRFLCHPEGFSVPTHIEPPHKFQVNLVVGWFAGFLEHQHCSHWLRWWKNTLGKKPNRALQKNKEQKSFVGAEPLEVPTILQAESIGRVSQTHGLWHNDNDGIPQNCYWADLNLNSKCLNIPKNKALGISWRQNGWVSL